jgi:hypothetical protein
MQRQSLLRVLTEVPSESHHVNMCMHYFLILGGRNRSLTGTQVFPFDDPFHVYRISIHHFEQQYIHRCHHHC